MLEKNIENHLFKADTYEWQHGLGVQIDIFKEEKKVGSIRLLCEVSEEAYEQLLKIDKAELLQRALDGFLNQKTNTSLEAVISWQRNLDEAGHKASPLFAKLSPCFNYSA